MAVMLNFQDIHQQSLYPSHIAGTTAFDPLGRTWIYLQAAATITKGQILRPFSTMGIVLNADVDAAAAANTYRVTATGDFATSNLIDAHFLTERSLANKGHLYWLWIDAGAAQGQGGPIVNRVDDDRVDVYWINSTDGRIDSALTTSSDYVVQTETRVTPTDAAEDRAIAVAQQAVTDEYWFWGLHKGKGVVYLDTDGAAVDTGDMRLIPSTTAGQAVGTTGTATTSEVFASFGISLVGDQTADGLILANINCDWTWPFSRDASLYIPARWDAGNLSAAWPRLS